MLEEKKVLIAEDEKPLAKALQIKFKKVGIEAVVVFSGDEVFRQLEEEKFDLLLLDLMMPEMDGFSVLEKIKNENVGIDVVVTSNLSQEEDMKRCKELGAKDYIVKSNTPISEIVKKVRNMLSS